MALYEQLQLTTIVPALPVTSGCFSLEDEEFLLQISVDCELDDILLTDSIDWDALHVESPTSTSDNRRRKRTYELRKDEINALDKKAKLLSTQLNDLKHRAGIQDEQSIAQQQLSNHMLREMLRNQQLLVAGFRSMASAGTSDTVLSPVSTRIRLENDLAGRRKLLRDIKFQKIHDARRFLESRTQYSPMTSRFSESTSHLTHEGDAIAVRLDIVPLPEAKSVKQVFDAIMFYFAHQEICMTEMLADVTVREKNAERESREDKMRDIVQHRFLYTNPSGIQIETNSIQFSEYKLNHRCAFTGDLREDAIVTTDFVDQDDLFPYSPHEPIRKDITNILHVRSCKRPLETQGPSSECASPSFGGSAKSFATCHLDGMQQDATLDGGDDQMVVLTMWCQTNLRCCDFEISEDKAQDLIEDSDRVHGAILKCVRASLRSNSID